MNDVINDNDRQVARLRRYCSIGTSTTPSPSLGTYAPAPIPTPPQPRTPLMRHGSLGQDLPCAASSPTSTPPSGESSWSSSRTWALCKFLRLPRPTGRWARLSARLASSKRCPSPPSRSSRLMAPPRSRRPCQCWRSHATSSSPWPASPRSSGCSAPVSDFRRASRAPTMIPRLPLVSRASGTISRSNRSAPRPSSAQRTPVCFLDCALSRGLSIQETC